jgi:hypothetical protein
MTIINRTAAAVGLALFLAVSVAAAQPTRSCCQAPGLAPSGTRAQGLEIKDLPGVGQKCWIGEVNYFVYGFDKTPGLGTAMLRVRLFDKDGKRVSDLDITGRSDMPSMRGAHDSGDIPLELEGKGDYVLPVAVVMPGEWEVRLTFSRTKIVVFRGRLTFEI